MSKPGALCRARRMVEAAGVEPAGVLEIIDYNGGAHHTPTTTGCVARLNVESYHGHMPSTRDRGGLIFRT